MDLKKEHSRHQHGYGDWKQGACDQYWPEWSGRIVGGGSRRLIAWRRIKGTFHFTTHLNRWGTVPLGPDVGKNFRRRRHYHQIRAGENAIDSDDLKRLIRSKYRCLPPRTNFNVE
jgi:hypothetical protein